jgi:hypothetical protein
VPNDPRIGQAVDLADAFLGMLNVDGSPGADMVGLIGIRDEENGGLTPTQQLTDFDPNAVRNQFDVLRTEVVREKTPLYDGIDEAIEWLTNNADPAVQDKLTHRRPIILVFSDGIDRDYSDKTHETLIVSQAQESDIMIYAIGMEGRGAMDPGSLEALARQTDGAYITHNDESREEVISFLQNIVTQRQAYRVSFPLTLPRGDYDVRVRVTDTPTGAGSDVARVSSRLETPELTLANLPSTEVTVPYSDTYEGFVPTTVRLSVQVDSTDGIPRDPGQVTYLANGKPIGTSSSSPDYPLEWELSTVVTPTTEEQSQSYVIFARAEDPYLESEMTSETAELDVTWEAEDVGLIERILTALLAYWWIILLFILVVIGLGALLLMLQRTRGEMEKRPATPTGQFVPKKTQRMSVPDAQAPARGKIVVLQGPSRGQERRVTTQLIRVGRDQEYSDFPLFDQFVSNPHFSVLEEQGQFYIQDEGSTNKTKLNGTELQPHQRYPLRPDAIIEVGNTKMQFKRLGGETRRLRGGEPGAGDAGQGPQQGQPPQATMRAPQG